MLHFLYFSSVKLTSLGLDLGLECFSFDMDLGLEGSNIGLSLALVLAPALLFNIHVSKTNLKVQTDVITLACGQVLLCTSTCNIKIHCCVGV